MFLPYEEMIEATLLPTGAFLNGNVYNIETLNWLFEDDLDEFAKIPIKDLIAFQERLEDHGVHYGFNQDMVDFINNRFPYDFTVTTPGMTYDAAAKTIDINTIQFAAVDVFPDSVFIEVNHFTAADAKTPKGFGTMPLNTSGVGTYSLGSPVTLRIDEYAEILVYMGSDRVHLVTKLIVRPVTD